MPFISPHAIRACLGTQKGLVLRWQLMPRHQLISSLILCRLTGYLDDLIILPQGIALLIKLIPSDIMAERRVLAAASQNRPISWTAAAIFIAVWIGAVALCGWMVYRYFTDR